MAPESSVVRPVRVTHVHAAHSCSLMHSSCCRGCCCCSVSHLAALTPPPPPLTPGQKALGKTITVVDVTAKAEVQASGQLLQRCTLRQAASMPVPLRSLQVCVDRASEHNCAVGAWIPGTDKCTKCAPNAAFDLKVKGKTGCGLPQPWRVPCCCHTLQPTEPRGALRRALRGVL